MNFTSKDTCVWNLPMSEPNNARSLALKMCIRDRDRRSVDRNLCTEFFESFGKFRAPEYGPVSYTHLPARYL